MRYRIMADLVLALHVSIVVFVVAGLPLIILGNQFRWGWVNALWFRVLHFLAIGIVATESWLGITCPLTTLESWFRTKARQETYSGNFIEHLLTRILFYEAPPWVFTLAYSSFAVLVLLTWWKFPPDRKSEE